MIKVTQNKINSIQNKMEDLLYTIQLFKDLPKKDKNTAHQVSYYTFIELVDFIKKHADDPTLYYTLVPRSYSNGVYSMSWRNVAPALRRGRDYIDNLNIKYNQGLSTPILKSTFKKAVGMWVNDVKKRGNYNLTTLNRDTYNVLTHDPSLHLPKLNDDCLIDAGFHTNDEGAKFINKGFKSGLNMGRPDPATNMLRTSPKGIFFIMYVPNGIADVRYNGLGTAESLDDFGVPGWKVTGVNLKGFVKILLAFAEQDMDATVMLFNKLQEDTDSYIAYSGK